MFVLQFPKDSSSLISKIKPKELPLGDYALVAYGRGMELPAFTYERARIELEGKVVKVVPLHEMLFLEDAYTDEKDVLVLANDQSEVKEALDNLWSLGVKADLLTCGNVEGKGNVNVIQIKEELCEVNLSLSMLRSIVGLSQSPRAKRLLEEMELPDLKEWAEKKAQEIDQELDVVLSPVLMPARYLVEENLGRNVKTYYDTNFYNSNVIFTGLDALVMRRISFQLRAKSMKVKEVLLDVDPLMAPIYLSIISYIIKLNK